MQAAQKPVIVHFYTDWCNPCKIANAELEYYAKNHKDEGIYVKINCDENEESAIEYGINVMPTLIAFKKCEKVGEEKGSRVEKLRDFINGHLGIK